MKKFLVLLTCLFTILFFAGCSDSGSGTSSATNSSSKNQELNTEIWNSYVGVSNSIKKISNGLQKYIEVYGSDPQVKRPDRMTSFVNAMLNTSPDDKLAQAIEKAIELNKKSSGSNLDQASAAFLPPAQELWQALSEAKIYYYNKNYIDDNYAKAQSIHEKIMVTYPLYYETMGNFNEQMDITSREYTQIEIKEMKANGQVITAAMLTAVDAAQQMQEVLFAGDIGDQNLQQLDMHAYRAAYDKFVQTLAEYEKISGDKNQIKKEGLSDYGVSNVLSGLQSVKKAAAALIERHQRKPRPTSSPVMTEGTPEHLHREMDYLIDRYNKAIGL